MKPNFEKVPTAANASWYLLDRRLPDAIPFEWHHHPEYELTLTLNSCGHRYVSSDVRSYTDGDLILIGPNVPHSWRSLRRLDPQQPHTALVIWFSRAWAEALVNLLPELAGLQDLLAAARCALQFSAEVAAQVRPLIEAMADQPAAERLVTLLAVLTRLARDTGGQRVLPPTASDGLAPAFEDPRMHRVLEYIHGHYREPLAIPELAQMACVSVSAFHRMFRRHARATALEYISRLRIGHACALLLQGQGLSVARIAEQAGYSSLALFNRQFKVQQGMTPSAFRQRHAHHFR